MKKAGDPSTYRDPLTGMEFVFVKGGCYEMGDVFGDGGKDEGPVHRVCLDDFYMGKYEVTLGQWQQLVGINPPSSQGSSGLQFPVSDVNWEEGQAYARALSRLTGQPYRLPTEAEWEYACRSGGKREKWPGTSDGSAVGKYVNHGSIWSPGMPLPGGRKLPNGLGLYDLGGNVAEWVADTYSADAYGRHALKNPVYLPAGGNKVIRGGSSRVWSDDLCRCMTRRDCPGSLQPDKDYPKNGDNFFCIGFRLVRDK